MSTRPATPPIATPAPSRKDAAYEGLRRRILDNVWPPGHQALEQEIALELGLSRTPVREALLRLGTSGLVVALPGRSTTVSTIDAAAVRDARDVIAAMHALAVRQVAGQLGEEQLDSMRDANRRFIAAVEAGDIDGALDADEELHRVPITALGNHALEAVLDHFDPLVRRVERLRFSSDGRASVDLHNRLIDLLAAGDADGASDVAFETWHSLPAEDGSEL